MQKHLDHKRFITTVSRVGAALVVLSFSAAVSAIEATEFDIPASVKSREQVRQELAQARSENRHLSRGQGSEYNAFEHVSQHSRQAVRAQAQLNIRAPVQRELFSGG